MIWGQKKEIWLNKKCVYKINGDILKLVTAYNMLLFIHDMLLKSIKSK